MRTLDWQRLTRRLDGEFGIGFRGDVEVRAVGGGDISSAWCLDDGTQRVFLKSGPAAALPLFECEQDGLAALASAQAIRVPQVLGCGLTDATSFLALEWLDLGGARPLVEKRLGEQLAAQHRLTGQRFGWHRDNFIGATPQPNSACTAWLEFFQHHRLGWQLQLAAERGHNGELAALGKQLMAALPRLLEGHAPDASLLHGDLWAGNHAAVGDQPVVFDPAVHYGDRECDLAMTRLFGGFGPEFYRAYESAWPLPAGHETRLPLYQLYHVLNHLNLFGQGYAARAKSLMRGLLRAVD